MRRTTFRRTIRTRRSAGSICKWLKTVCCLLAGSGRFLFVGGRKKSRYDTDGEENVIEFGKQFDYDRTMNTHQVSLVFKALACEQRLKLLLLLLEWCDDLAADEGLEKCFTRACESLHLSRSTISHHFRELEKAGLIDCTRSGQNKVCRINREAVTSIRGFAEIVDRRSRHAGN